MYRFIQVTLLAAFISGTLSAAEFETLAPYLTGDEAAAAGEKIGIGTAVIVKPLQAEVFTHQTIVLKYVAGPAGIKAGGGIRIGQRHVTVWSRCQMDKPKMDGYVTAKTSSGVPIKMAGFFGIGKNSMFDRYHPWQNILEIKFPEQGLAPGDTMQVIYGDTSGGSRGIRTQPFDEKKHVFKFYVDTAGDGNYLPIRNNPSLELVPSDPHRLGIVMPSDAVAGKPVWCIVRAEDRYGNPTSRYEGRVEFESSDAKAQLPTGYTFKRGDCGVKRFDNIVFNSAGPYTVTVRDGDMKRIGNPVRVTNERSKLMLLWGDLHGHTLFSDGRGTVEEFYDFAENTAGLDFCAVSDHAFEMLNWMWEHSKKVTNGVYKPGRFVTFQAYEWSGQSNVGGDHNVYFLDRDPPIYRSRSYYNYNNLQMYHGSEPMVNHVEDLFSVLARDLNNKNVFCIPHYGGRTGNPNWHNPKVQRMIEIFSEHRRSEDWATTFLKKRYRLGIMASTDGHYGNPGYGYLMPTYDWTKQEIGMAAVAVYAPLKTRESIFRALYDRHVYATSGDRIILDFRADGHVMGSEYKTDTSPTLTVRAVGTAPIVKVEIKKDSQIVHTLEPGKVSIDLKWQDPSFDPKKECYYYVRILQANNEEAISSPVWIN